MTSKEYYHKRKLRAVQLLNESEPSKPLEIQQDDTSFVEAIIEARTRPEREAKAKREATLKQKREYMRKKRAEEKKQLLSRWQDDL